VQTRRALAARHPVGSFASMALKMRDVCERCAGPLAPSAEAFICSYECTFCASCTQELESICPNCGGELVRRPRRNVP
jgi:hypothetical protein